MPDRLPLPMVRIDGVPHVAERVAIVDLEEWGMRHNVIPAGHVVVEGAWPPFVIYERRRDDESAIPRGGS